jgi:hypothetical protein
MTFAFPPWFAWRSQGLQPGVEVYSQGKKAFPEDYEDYEDYSDIRANLKVAPAVFRCATVPPNALGKMKTRPRPHATPLRWQ